METIKVRLTAEALANVLTRYQDAMAEVSRLRKVATWFEETSSSANSMAWLTGIVGWQGGNDTRFAVARAIHAESDRLEREAAESLVLDGVPVGTMPLGPIVADAPHVEQFHQSLDVTADSVSQTEPPPADPQAVS